MYIHVLSPVSNYFALLPPTMWGIYDIFLSPLADMNMMLASHPNAQRHQHAKVREIHIKYEPTWYDTRNGYDGFDRKIS